jgi:hypothetical protein
VTGWVLCHAGDRILIAKALAFATRDQPGDTTFLARDEASRVTPRVDFVAVLR